MKAVSDASHHVFVDPARRWERQDPESFDRIAFAMRALALLRPRIDRIAVYSSIERLVVERGRDLKSDGDRDWALVGIPPHASRQSIAMALAELVGVAGTPFVVDLLVLAGRGAGEAAA